MDAGPQGGTCWRAAGYGLERVALFSINCLQRLVAMYDLLVCLKQQGTAVLSGLASLTMMM
jgi:hypothetical protein